MKKYAVVLAAVGLLILSLATGVFASGLAWEDIGGGNLNLETVLVENENPQIIYIGTSAGVLKTEDAGGQWRNILSTNGQNKGANFLLFAPKDKNILYAATQAGLFYSANAGKNWKRIFRGKNAFENECTGLAILPSGIYLGTKAGLFVSKDFGRSWYKETGKIGKSHILAIAYNLKEPDYIYIACVDGVFKTSDAGKSWERIFVAYPTENGDDKDEINEDHDEQEKSSGIRYISCDPNNLNCLYAATSRGIDRSCDRGQSWESVSSYGLLSQDIKFLLAPDKSHLYAVTKSGIFEYKGERWQELSFALTAGEIRFLALDNQDNLYAACDKGLFKANLTYFSDDRHNNIVSLYFENEPKVNEVQQAAIKYAEVEPGKIIKWRKQAKMKAILPKLTVGLDRSESTNYEIYTNATTHYAYEGPNDKSNGWDVTLTWELGDLIFSDDQTSIDVRSRLMVQLRPLNVHILSLL